MGVWGYASIVGGDEGEKATKEPKSEIVLTAGEVLIEEFRLSSIFLVKTNFEQAAGRVDSAYLAHCLECTMDPAGSEFEFKSM